MAYSPTVVGGTSHSLGRHTTLETQFYSSNIYVIAVGYKNRIPVVRVHSHDCRAFCIGSIFVAVSVPVVAFASSNSEVLVRRRTWMEITSCAINAPNSLIGSPLTWLLVVHSQPTVNPV